MKKDVERMTAKCPYYVHHEKNRIFCEGIKGATYLISQFPSMHRREKYMAMHCGSVEKCEECQIHKLLNEKWGVSNAK